MASYLGYPFDPDLFLYNWQNERDPVLTALFDSGAVTPNGTIQSLIANGSNIYEIPVYKPLGGDADVYDGNADITVTDPEAASQIGVVYGRAHAWRDRDFVRDFNSGADPMRQIVSQVARYWQKKRQGTLLSILDGIFGVTDTDWQLHTTDISSATTTVADANKIGPATVAEATQKALGDSADQFSLVVTNSLIAKNLGVQNLIEFRKYTDAAGIERTLNIGDINGLTLVVDDGLPSTPAGTSAKSYTTYILGNGALHYAPASVDTPVEVKREALAAGGYNALVTRLRETIHPNGFKWGAAGQTAAAVGVPDTALGTAANWELVANHKNVPIARIISNG
jgi:hypothetical protein